MTEGIEVMNTDTTVKYGVGDSVPFKLTATMPDSISAYGEYTAVGAELTGTTSFNFSGLAAGDYKLVETTTPGGYNTMEDLEFTIAAESTEDADGNAHVTSLKIISQGGVVSDGNISGWVDAADTGVLSADVANFRGSELPSTGGTGTTLFYIAGNTAVVAACFVLVMKKKENVA